MPVAMFIRILMYERLEFLITILLYSLKESVNERRDSTVPPENHSLENFPYQISPWKITPSVIAS